MASRILTPANQITILRLIFVPIFAILVMEGRYVWALLALTIAAASDVLDGLVARVFKQETPLGIALDPIADKILMTTAYFVLAFRGALPWWLTILVISRDVAIVMTAALISLVAGYRPFRPSALGKASTTMQVITVFVAVARQAGIPAAAGMLLQACLYLTAFFTVASGVHYLLVVRQRYAPQEEEQPAESSSKSDK
jgi:cardiolipin synthase